MATGIQKMIASEVVQARRKVQIATLRGKIRRYASLARMYARDGDMEQSKEYSSLMRTTEEELSKL